MGFQAARTRALVLLLWIAFAALPLGAESPQGMTVSGGRYGVFRGNEDVEAGWEVHFAPRRFSFLPESVPDIIPVAGALATGKGTLYGYGGFRADFPLGERWVLTPHWGVGLYYTADGRNLGGALTFRSAVEVAYRLSEHDRIGLCAHHLSNARIYRRNPGSESLILTYSTSFPGKRRR